MNNPITALQDSIQARLQGDDYFSDASAESPRPMTVLTEKVGDIAAAIDEAINKIGISPLIVTPKVHPGSRKGSIIVDITVAFTELAIVNRDPATGTGKPAIDACLMALVLLWFWRPSDMWSPLDFDGMEMMSTKPLIHEVRFKASTFVSISSS